MRILLLGSTGMAGAALAKTLKARGYSVLGVARSNSDHNCDISDEDALNSILRLNEYDAVINAAALVDVNRCDDHPMDSWNINAKPLSILSNWSQKFNVPVLHISTDHYYAYGENKAHTEEDPVFFFNEYARHKYVAEAFALTSKHSLVLRTSILGERASGNLSLVEWALQELPKQEATNLFRDAWTSSMDVQTFADLACEMFFDKKQRGLINLAAGEVFSKETLIRRLADKLSIPHEHCVSASIKDFCSKRANCLGLDVSKAEKILGKPMPTLDEVCDSLIAQMNS